MTRRNRQVILAARPDRMPKESDFRLVETPMRAVEAGEFLVRTKYFSVDPYMRLRISEAILRGAGSASAR